MSDANRYVIAQPCPTCDGVGGVDLTDSMLLYGVPGGQDYASRCPDCNGSGFIVPPTIEVPFDSDPQRQRIREAMHEHGIPAGLDPGPYGVPETHRTLHATGPVIPVYPNESAEGDDSPTEYPCIAMTTSGNYYVASQSAEGVPIDGDFTAGTYVQGYTKENTRD